MSLKSEGHSLEWLLSQQDDIVINYMPDPAKVYCEDNEIFWRHIELHFTKQLAKSGSPGNKPGVFRKLLAAMGLTKGITPAERSRRESIKNCLRLSRKAKRSSVGLLPFDRNAEWFVVLEEVRTKRLWVNNKTYKERLNDIVLQVLGEIGSTPKVHEKDSNRKMKQCAALIALANPDQIAINNVIELFSELNEMEG